MHSFVHSTVLEDFERQLPWLALTVNLIQVRNIMGKNLDWDSTTNWPEYISIGGGLDS